MKNIMFVCTSNVCRSPMAEGILKDKIKKEGKGKEIFVYSSGLYAYTGDEATNHAILAVKDMGIDISPHRATNIKDSDIENMDLILCMTIRHKHELTYMYPNLVEMIFTLKEYAGEKNNVNINDPWGDSLESYKNSAKEIVDAINKIKI